jgi:hypothetical protein
MHCASDSRFVVVRCHLMVRVRRVEFRRSTAFGDNCTTGPLCLTAGVKMKR